MTFEEQLEDFPNQFSWEAQIENSEKLPEQWESALVCGMGGSALPGLLLQSGIIEKEVNVHRDYGLPQNIKPETLVIVISYSGNTEEALSSYKEALQKRMRVAVITSGGKLEELAKKDDVAYAAVPEGIQPRIAVGYLLTALVDITGAPKAKNIDVDTDKAKKIAKELAEKIDKSIPLFYASGKNKALAYIAKIQVNENAKRHAFYNIFPEINHNEMEGYEVEGQDVFTVFLKDNNDEERVQERMSLTEKLIKKRGYKTHTIDITNPSWYNGVIYSLLLGDWLSYYMAVRENINPEPVNLVEEFKKELK